MTTTFNAARYIGGVRFYNNALVPLMQPTMSERTMTISQSYLNNDPNVTEEEVLQYLLERSLEAVPGIQIAMDVNTFWQPDDLAEFRRAQAWWPRDAPQHLACPYLGILCWGIVTLANLPQYTFSQQLMLQVTNVVKWLQAEDRNIANPNESAQDRKRRKGREAVARHTRLKAEAEVNPKVQELRDLHAAYINACKQRKAAATAWDETVAATKQAWLDAKAALTGQTPQQ